VAITILMICYTLIALWFGWYLFSHRQRTFLVFHPESTPALSKVVATGGVLLLIVGILSAIATFLNNTVFIAAVLLVGIIIIVSLQVILVRWLPKS